MDCIHDNLSVKVNTTNPDEHVGYIERLNRTLKEKFRTNYHRLLFKAIPRLVFEYIVMVTTQAENFSPIKGSIRKYFSPHVLLGKNNMDYSRDF